MTRPLKETPLSHPQEVSAPQVADDGGEVAPAKGSGAAELEQAVSQALRHLSPEDADLLAESICETDAQGNPVYVLDIKNIPVEKDDLAGKVAGALLARSRELPSYKAARKKQREAEAAQAAGKQGWREAAKSDLAKRYG